MKEPLPFLRSDTMKYIVDMADMKVSSKKSDELITYSLGSCLGISAYDHTAGVGGLLHIMLPLSSINPAKAVEKPCMYVDTGIPKFLNKCFKAGARKSRLEIKVAGGAYLQAHNMEDHFFNIGKRNFLVLRKLLWKNGLLMKSCDIGGNLPRTMILKMGTGKVYIKNEGKTKEL